MKTMLMSVVVAAALGSGAAVAADMPLKAAPAPAYYSWTGLYIGGHVGAAWDDADFTWNLPSLGAFASHTTNTSAIGGGQIGALYQWGNVVLGVEGSWSGTDLRGRQVASFEGFVREFDTRVESLALVTGRLGFAWDRFLVYGKGGYANAEVKLDTYRVSDRLHQTSSSGRVGGWTAGGGAEYAFSQNWTFGVEYNFVRLEPSDRLHVNIAPTIDSNHEAIGVDIHAVWARLNYKFGPGSARY